MTRMLSLGLRASRSRKPHATVDSALRRLEQRRADLGAPGSPRRMLTYSASSFVSLAVELAERNLASSSTWSRPRLERGESKNQESVCPDNTRYPSNRTALTRPWDEAQGEG